MLRRVYVAQSLDWLRRGVALDAHNPPCAAAIGACPGERLGLCPWSRLAALAASDPACMPDAGQLPSAAGGRLVEPHPHRFIAVNQVQ